MFHKHRWKIVEQTEQPSPSELAGGRLPQAKGDLAFVFMQTYFQRPVIVKRVCETCGSEDVRRV